MLGVCRYCLDFSKFGYVTYIIFYVSKKSLGHRKMFSLHGRNQNSYVVKNTSSNNFLCPKLFVFLKHRKVWDNVQC